MLVVHSALYQDCSFGHPLKVPWAGDRELGSKGAEGAQDMFQTFWAFDLLFIFKGFMLIVLAKDSLIEFLGPLTLRLYVLLWGYYPLKAGLSARHARLHFCRLAQLRGSTLKL